MRIVVTGGAGFIGSHLCGRLLDAGHDVICVDNLITGDRRNIAQLERDHSRLLFKYADISRPTYIDGDVDWIFHFASPASPEDYSKYPIQTLKVGALGTYHMLGMAKDKKSRILLASTSEVYGDPLVSPQKETYWGNVNPLSPRGVYDEAKRYAEALIMAYHNVHGVDIRIARIFNTYGPRMRVDDGRVVPNFLVQALRGEPLTVYGDGRQTRSFCFIDDLVDGIIKLMETPYHGPVNLGNPDECTILEFAETVRRVTGSRAAVAHKPLPVDDPKVRCPDISLAREKLGWRPAVGLEDGLRRTCDDIRGRLEQKS